MSPHAADQFTGHLFEGDPRTLCHGAGGCRFPTMPAMRYLLFSGNPTGLFTVWQFTPGLMIRMVDTVDHDLFAYVGVSIPPPFSLTLARKVYNPETWGYRWELDFDMGSGCSTIEFRIERPFEKCNQDVLLGTGHCMEHPEFGEFGDTFSMQQVKWDETQPP